MNRCVIFDVDGTLFDTGEGIRLCVVKSLEKSGVSPLPADKLNSFIGPSLYDSFTRTVGLSDAAANAAVDTYRELYQAYGLDLSHPYPGIDALLFRLHAQGYTLAVASSKPLTMVNYLLEKFGFAAYFARVCAPDYARRGSDKAALITAAAGGQPSIMVGDTHFDVEGAHGAGLKAVAVTFGYGAKDTLFAADATADAAEEIYTLVTTRDDLFCAAQ